MNKSNRLRGKPFQPGNSFSEGRPAGSRNKLTLALQSLLEGEGEILTRKTIELALAGDRTALRVCMERLLPICRDRRVELELPSITSVTDICSCYQAILVAVSQGNLTIGEAEQLGRVVESAGKAFEAQDVSRRLAELEKRLEDYDETRAA